MSADCIFCRILKKEIASKAVYEDKYTYAFYDINPQSKKHILVIPKEHVEDFYSLSDDTKTLNHLLVAVKNIVKKEGIVNSGFRLVTNIGDDACQTVKHLHLHIMGGNQLSGKMG